MPRIIGIDVPDKKRLEIALTYIYGIGRKLSNEIIEKLKLNKDLRASQLTEEQIAQLNAILTSEYIVEGDLRRQVQNNIKRLVGIHCYRGMRHRLRTIQRLPEYLHCDIFHAHRPCSFVSTF